MGKHYNGPQRLLFRCDTFLMIQSITQNTFLIEIRKVRYFFIVVTIRTFKKPRKEILQKFK